MAVPFSVMVAPHRHKASGFDYKDLLYEIFDNSDDATKSILKPIIQFDFIQNNNDRYVIFADNGIGSSDPEQFFGKGSNVKKKTDLTGCKNTGFIATISVNEPEAVYIATKQYDNKNKCTLYYDSKEHYNQMDQLKIKYNSNYSLIKEDPLFKNSVSGDIRDIIRSNEQKINLITLKLFNEIDTEEKNKGGTIIILKFSINNFERLINETINSDDNQFFKHFCNRSKGCNKLSIYNNNKLIDKPVFEDILKNKFLPLIINVDVYETSDKKLKFLEKFYANEIKETNLLFTNQVIQKGNPVYFGLTTINTKDDKLIGSFILKYQYLNSDDFEKIGNGYLKANDKRSLIMDLNDKFRILCQSTDRDSTDLRNAGPFLFSLLINNIGFAETHLGIKTNKRLSSYDAFNPIIKQYIMNRVRKTLINNISTYTLAVDHGSYLKKRLVHKGNENGIFRKEGNESKYIAQGITDWKPFNKYIKEIFSEDKKKSFKNIHSKVYEDLHPLPESESEIELESDSEPDLPKESQLKINNTNKYWGEFTFDINNKDFNLIHIHVHSNHNEIIQRKIIRNNDDSTVYINNLSPHIEYTIKIIGIQNKFEQKEKLFKIKTDNKCVPEPPDFIIDNTTHDVKITFQNVFDNGLPISRIIIYKNKSTVPTEQLKFSSSIILPKFTHKPCKIELAFVNEAGTSKHSKIYDINLICKKVDFTEQTKQIALNNFQNKCAITGITLDTNFFRCQFDHIEFPCDNSVSNCQPLLTQMHDIKTYNSDLYDRIKRSEIEMFNMKKKLIQGIFNSLSNIEKKSIKDDFNERNSVI